MTPRFIIPCATTLCLAATSGCAPRAMSDAANREVTVKAALHDIAAGFKDYRETMNVGQPLRLGLLTCEISVSFQISNVASSSDGVSATLAAPVKVINLSGTAKYDESDTLTRGNTVNIDLHSFDTDVCGKYTAPTATPVAAAATPAATTGSSSGTTKVTTSATQAAAGAGKGDQQALTPAATARTPAQLTDLANALAPYLMKVVKPLGSLPRLDTQPGQAAPPAPTPAPSPAPAPTH